MSTSILPRDPSQTTLINDPAHEAQRLNFLNRFINNPCMMSVCLCIRDYLNSSLCANTYVYQFLSKNWKKNNTLNNFSPQELFVLVANYESGSFARDCVHVIIQDCQYNMDQQQAIIDNENSTEQQVKVATVEKFKFKAYRDRLNEYRKDFLNYQVVTSEVIKTLEVLLAVQE